MKAAELVLVDKEKMPKTHNELKDWVTRKIKRRWLSW